MHCHQPGEYALQALYALQDVAGKSWPELQKCGWGWGESGQIGKIRAQIVFVKLLGIQGLCKQTLRESLGEGRTYYPFGR